MYFENTEGGMDVFTVHSAEEKGFSHLPNVAESPVL